MSENEGEETKAMRKWGRWILLTGLGVVVALLLVKALSLAGIFGPAHPAAAILTEQGVLIDPGHGGFDVGAIGVSGSEEDKLNLEMAQALKQELESRGIPAELLRPTQEALAQTKEADMEARAQAIRESTAAVLISLHMNSFPQDASVHGPQVFYQQDSHIGQDFASVLQPYLNDVANGTRKPAAQRLIVLSAAEGVLPGVLVECGFLTNAEEEENLKKPGYRKRFAAALADGIQAYCQG